MLLHLVKILINSQELKVQSYNLHELINLKHTAFIQSFLLGNYHM